MTDDPQKLSDIDINVHGFTAQDIINGRHARNEMIRDGANQGNFFSLEAERLHAEAKLLGYDWTYEEDLDEEDLL